MSYPNGSAPLRLNAHERAALLRKVGINAGWVLMSVSEMFDLKKNMDGCSAENERLNKQAAKILARGILHAAIADKSLRSARALLVIIADRDAEPAMRIDALREIAWIDEALAVLPTPNPDAPVEEKK